MSSRLSQILNVYFAAILISLCFILLTSAVFADEINYSYDDAGRLVKVEKGSERILYQYDEVGNLLSISGENSVAQAAPPVLQSINPDIFLVGDHYNITLTGQNLLTTSRITSDNPGITINNITALNSQVIATLAVASGASPGQSNLTVTTSYGSATIPVGIYQASITPGLTSLFPGSSLFFSVSLTPAASKTVTVPANNKTPGIIDLQPSVTVPPGGNAGFVVKAVRGGTGTVQIGTAEATIYVVEGNGLMNASPVCVLVGSVPGNTVIYSQPVSAIISSVPGGPVIVYNAVSVGWPVTWNLSVSSSVSVVWPTVSGAVTVSMPVCVKIGD